MTPTTPTREPVRLPVEADAARIFDAFQGAHDKLEPTIWALADVSRFDGSEPDLEPITEVHLSALVTIRADLVTLLDELDLFKSRLDCGIRAVVAIRGEQQGRAQRAA